MPRRAGERSAGIAPRPRPAAAALLLAAAAGLRSAAALPASLSGPGAPVYPLSPQLTPAQLLNAAVLNAGAAWPNTSGTSTLACPTCGAAAVTPIWCASARVAAYLRPDSGTTQLGDAFVRLQPTATAAIAAVRALAEGQAYTVDYTQVPTVLAGSNAWCARCMRLHGARERALRPGARARRGCARVAGRALRRECTPPDATRVRLTARVVAGCSTSSTARCLWSARPLRARRGVPRLHCARTGRR